MTVAEFVRARVDQWEAAGDISARTAQRYRQLVENQIAPHIGTNTLQKLSRSISRHGTPRYGTWPCARKRAALPPRTIGHAHRVLCKALSDAAKNELVIRNVAKSRAGPEGARQRNGDRHDVPALFEQAERLAARASLRWWRCSPACDEARCWLCAGAVSISIGKVIQVREALEHTKAHGIRFKPPKSKAGRRDITLPDILVEALREAPQGRSLNSACSLAPGGCPKCVAVRRS